MSSREEALKVGLHSRLQALRGHLAELSAHIGGGRTGLQMALAMVMKYPAWIESLIPQIDSFQDEEDRVDELALVSQHVVRRTQTVEAWFSRGASLRVPAALFGAVERACVDLDLANERAVVAIGRADNLETLLKDLTEAFFSALPRWKPPEGLERDKFAMIQVPRFEGGDGLWWPLILGHEMAHLRCLKDKTAADFRIIDRLDWTRFEKEFGPTVQRRGKEVRTVDAFRDFYDETAHQWALELICDAYAIYRFGPAGAASLAEFLDVNGDMLQPRKSHPPGLLRVRLAVRWLEGLIGDSADAVVQPCREQAAAEFRAEFPAGADDGFAVLLEAFEALASAFMEAVTQWFPAAGPRARNRYDSRARENIIGKCIGDLRDGVPPREVLRVDGQEVRPIEEDIILAGWAVRQELKHEGRYVADALVSKALENIELDRRWNAKAKAGAETLAPEPGPELFEYAGGVVTQAVLKERLNTDDLDHRIVIAPSFALEVGKAAIDIRLGTRFIVLRRSHVPSFTTLSDIDVQGMQEQVEVGWGESFTLHPGELALAATLEYIRLPGDLAAQVVTRSSYGRLGLITATAVQVHPNYRGCLTLELVNHGQVPLELTPGERIAQLVLWTVTPVVKPDPRSTFKFAIWPEFSRGRFGKEEARVLRELGKPPRES